MTRQEVDEALFKRVRKKFAKWSPSKCSGYVHGVHDGLEATAPQPDPSYCLDVKIRGYCASGYSTGYVYGFIDAYGSDAHRTSWYRDMMLAMKTRLKLDYRWWTQDD